MALGLLKAMNRGGMVSFLKVISRKGSSLSFLVCSGYFSFACSHEGMLRYRKNCAFTFSIFLVYLQVEASSKNEISQSETFLSNSFLVF